MAHNQLQFQQIYQKLRLRLKPCKCTEEGFAQVDYRKGKSITIYHNKNCPVVLLNRDECPPSVKTEEDFVALAVQKWNNREYTSC